MKRDIFYNWHKRSLKQHTTEVDIDAIWAAIEPEVDAINVDRKKKRRFFFFFTFLFIGAIGLGIAGLSYSNKTTSNQHINSNSNIKEILPKQGTQIATINVEDQTKDDAITQTEENSDPLETNKSTDTTIPLKNFSPSSILKNDDNQKKLWRHSRSNSPSEVRIASNTPTIQESTNKFIPLGEKQLTSFVKDETETDIIDASSIDDARAIVSIPNFLPFSQFSELENTEESFPSTKIKTTKQAPFQLSISAYSGLAIVNRKLSQKDASESNELLILREGTEKNLELWNNGLRLKLAHKSGVHFSLGVQYSRIAENFQYDTDYLVMDSIANQVIGYSNNLLGDRSEIYGYQPNNTLYDLEYDFYNYHHFIELPISIGYQKQFGYWNLGIRSTYVHNLSLQSKGRVLESAFEVSDIGEPSISPFANKAKASYEGGISAAYRLTSNLEVGVEGFYRYAPNSITKEEYTLNQKYSWGGINASLNYHF